MVNYSATELCVLRGKEREKIRSAVFLLRLAESYLDWLILHGYGN